MSEEAKSQRTAYERVWEAMSDIKSGGYHTILALIPRQYLPDFAHPDMTAPKEYVNMANAMDARRNSLQGDHADLVKEVGRSWREKEPENAKQPGRPDAQSHSGPAGETNGNDAESASEQRPDRVRGAGNGEGAISVSGTGAGSDSTAGSGRLRATRDSATI
ncbi:MAG: hypothetical protein U5K56_09925 [Halioglobus sp.]|nr:hypothetical protein [Halioglobus sp.]